MLNLWNLELKISHLLNEIKEKSNKIQDYLLNDYTKLEKAEIVEELYSIEGNVNIVLDEINFLEEAIERKVRNE